MEDEISDFHLTRWRAWLNVLLKISQVASLQITLHVRSIISVAPLRKLMDLCLDRLTFYFLLASPAWLLSLKKKTIPRVELTADTVSDRLNKILTKKLELPINGFTFWTDSMTVIRYIANELKRFHTYVANRIAVREESNLPHWKYIITASPIPLMKLHQELQQTCSSAMAVEERSRISYHHLSLSGRTVPKNTQFDKIYLYR